jgi:hypothetical protein
VDEDTDLIIRSLKKIFEIYAWVDECRIGGAEVFLWRDAEILMRETIKYSAQFDRVSVITNGSYVPKESMLKTFGELQCDKFIRVDDYGRLSPKVSEVVKKLKEYNIPVDLRSYNETEQAFGGWVDLGDFEDMGYSADELARVHDSCRVPDDCLCLWDGKLFNCTYSAAGMFLKKFEMRPEEYIDLWDDETIEQKRARIKNWNKVLLTGCAYCKGFDPENSPRVPAAIQI